MIMMMVMMKYKTNKCHKIVTLIRFIGDDDDNDDDEDEYLKRISVTGV